jgi:hypothetical protein
MQDQEMRGRRAGAKGDEGQRGRPGGAQEWQRQRAGAVLERGSGGGRCCALRWCSGWLAKASPLRAPRVGDWTGLEDGRTAEGEGERGGTEAGSRGAGTGLFFPFFLAGRVQGKREGRRVVRIWADEKTDCLFLELLAGRERLSGEGQRTTTPARAGGSDRARAARPFATLGAVRLWTDRRRRGTGMQVFSTYPRARNELWRRSNGRRCSKGR